MAMMASNGRTRASQARGRGSIAGRILKAVGDFLRGLGFLITEVWGFMRVRKRYWMAPFFVVLLLFGLLIALVQNAAVAQFIYTLF
jgi:hypothetical protein